MRFFLALVYGFSIQLKSMKKEDYTKLSKLFNHVLDNLQEGQDDYDAIVAINEEADTLGYDTEEIADYLTGIVIGDSFDNTVKRINEMGELPDV